MPEITTAIIRDTRDVGQRLEDLQLGPLARILYVVKVARAARADATRFHAANAGGTFAYQNGIARLRFEFVDGEIWLIDRPNNVEVIKNENLKLMIAYTNVYKACDDYNEPEPISSKGAGTERVCSGNINPAFPLMFESLPKHVPHERGGYVTYYLMVDPEGAAELSCPIVKNGAFVAYRERIYLSAGGDGLYIGSKVMDDSPLDEFDPAVLRK